MSLRVLIIDDEDVYRRLLAQHVATAFDHASVAEYDPAARGRLPTEFQASAYDVVLLDDHPGKDSGADAFTRRLCLPVQGQDRPPAAGDRAARGPGAA